MSKKLYHFKNGNLSSSFDTLVLTGSNTSIISTGGNSVDISGTQVIESPSVGTV